MISPEIPAFFIASVIIFIGFFGSVLLNKYSIPDTIFLIAFGYFLGSGSALIFGKPFLSPSEFENIAPVIGALALIAIMFESSLDIDINELIVTARPALILSIFSFFLSTILTYIILYYVLPIFGFYQFTGDVLVTLLLSSIIGGSSGAVVASIATRIAIPSNIQLTLSIESVLTDVYVIVSALTILSIITAGTTELGSIGSFIASRFSVSLVIGGIAGIFLSNILHRLRREKHLYTMTFAFLILLYAGTEFLNGSGAISVLTAGIILSNIGVFTGFIKNNEMIEIVKFQRYNLETLHSELTLLLRIFFFVEVGLIINLTHVDTIIVSIILSLLLLIARFLPSFSTAKILGFNIGRGIAATAMSFMYGRGLAAAVMAIIAKQQLSKFIEIPEVLSYLVEIPSAVVLFTNIIMTIGIVLIRKEIRRLI